MAKLIKYRHDSEWDILHLASLSPAVGKYAPSDCDPPKQERIRRFRKSGVAQ
jgi:hypothetical protein